MLLRLCAKVPWVGWACVSAKLGGGRNENACCKQWHRLQQHGAGEAEAEAKTGDNGHSMEDSQEGSREGSDGDSSVSGSSDG
jgi:hypothetical protein